MPKIIILIFLALLLPSMGFSEIDANNVGATTGGTGCIQGSNESKEGTPGQESIKKYKCVLFDSFVTGACGCDEEGNIKDTDCLQKVNKSVQ